ncbi:amidohydrolase family protein [Pseudoroseicyclus tamaricis]|uniref:Amidohydrolase family protein n=1 Tax=Pseudoroseicyclus tamaricis TaxID=2705421 RepID=A0A6B2JH23_9RHOB|nr:amidohydrolase family protein [Pseudoroseicyclus tamaricis]NDV00503.1 amidohydrolase family protein [Pseudoroseicyclus tamaricis]
MASRTCVIRGGRILRPGADTAPPADILVRDGKIALIGAPGMEAPEDCEQIDAAGCLLHPGLVNGHTHGHGHYSRALTDDLTLETLLAGSFWLNGNRSHEDKYLSTLIGAAEMVLKGCTACYDLFWEFPTASYEGMATAGRAYSDVGMRAVMAPMVADGSFLSSIPGLIEAIPEELRAEITPWTAPSSEALLSRLAAIDDAWPFDRDQVAFALGPTVPLLCSDEFLSGAARLARDRGLPIQTHLSESRIQEVTARERWGRSLTEHLADVGFLGPNLSVAHAVWLNDTDIALLAEAGATAVLNPSSNLRLGSGLPRMRRLLDAGMNVALGTDSASCGDHQNMYEVTRLAGYMSHVQSPNAEDWVTSAEAARAATEGGAKALGMHGIGKLDVGYAADIVFLDLGWVHWMPLRNVTMQLVQAEDATAVRHVMIDGHMIVRDRRLMTVDLARLQRQVTDAVARLDTLNADNKALFRKLQPVIGQFCAAFSPHPQAGAAPLPPTTGPAAKALQDTRTET